MVLGCRDPYFIVRDGRDPYVTSHECSHRGGNVLTAVGMFSPRWECSHRGENIPTAVRSKNKQEAPGLIAPPFIIGFLATENLPKVKLD